MLKILKMVILNRKIDDDVLGQYDRDFEAINNQMVNEQEEDIPITDEFRITALDYNHDFHNFETPNTNGESLILISHCK